MGMNDYSQVLRSGSDSTVRVHKEMSITRQEFVRMLAAGLRPMTFSIVGDRIEAVGGSGAVTILLSGDRERQIGLLKLPVIDVDFVLKDFSSDQVKRFLQHFDRVYQRGGG